MTSFASPIPGGWIRLHRQALLNGWLQNHRLWAFWCYCLLKASHQAIEVTVGYQRVHLSAGQFIFGRMAAAKELKMTERQIRTCQTSLISTGNLSVQTSNKFSVITVINWDSYQGTGQERDSQGVTPLVQQPTSNRPQTRIKELKKESISSFSVFWNAYPRKVGKAPAEKAWLKITPNESLLKQIVDALEWQAKQSDWLKDDGKFIPHPSTWLNGRRWEDEQPVSLQRSSQLEIPAYMTDPAFDDQGVTDAA